MYMEEVRAQEYMMLREEIMDCLKEIRNCKSIMYTVIVTILAFAVTQKEVLIILTTIVIILPIYHMDINKTSSMIRIGAYLYVFLEGDNFKWETRLIKYDELFLRKRKGETMVNIRPYIFTTTCCFLLFFMKLDYTNVDKSLFFRVVAGLIYYIYSLRYIYINKIDYKEEKKRYIKEWRDIQNIELNQH